MSESNRRPRKARHDLYEGYKEASGWYLAAWRDFRGLSVEDLVDETALSRGYLSDMEKGVAREGRPPARFNRDAVEKLAEALQTTPGRLIDVNPFSIDEDLENVTRLYSGLEKQDRDLIASMIREFDARRRNTAS